VPCGTPANPRDRGSLRFEAPAHPKLPSPSPTLSYLKCSPARSDRPTAAPAKAPSPRGHRPPPPRLYPLLPHAGRRLSTGFIKVPPQAREAAPAVQSWLSPTPPGGPGAMVQGRTGKKANPGFRLLESTALLKVTPVANSPGGLDAGFGVPGGDILHSRRQDVGGPVGPHTNREVPRLPVHPRRRQGHPWHTACSTGPDPFHMETSL